MIKFISRLLRAWKFRIVCWSLKSLHVSQRLVPSMPLTNLVRVDCSASASNKGTNRCSFFPASQATDRSAPQRRSRYRQFISMFLPERTLTSNTPPLSRSSRVCRSKRAYPATDCKGPIENPVNKSKTTATNRFIFCTAKDVFISFSPSKLNCCFALRARRVPV